MDSLSRYFNPRPPRGGRPCGTNAMADAIFISIHAPREGGDLVMRGCWTTSEYFNPRPPRGGRPWAPTWTSSNGNFNPRPPRGGRRLTVGILFGSCHFNPRPPRGGRRRLGDSRDLLTNFNPRPPRGGRPVGNESVSVGGGISIHAPREGGDSAEAESRAAQNHFNPRPPRGGRQGDQGRRRCAVLFQSTSPARGATYIDKNATVGILISIHAPREGGDSTGSCSRL